MSNVYAPPDANVDDVHRGGTAVVTDAIVESLRGTKGWVMLVAICLFLFAGLSVMGGIAMAASSAFMPAGGAAQSAGVMVAMGAFYILFAFIYGLLGFYLIRFHGAAARVVRDAQVMDLETALESQRKFWRMTGIMVLVGIVLMVVGMAAIMIPASMAFSGRGA